MSNPEEHPEVVVCAGSPACPFMGNDAIAASVAGCPRCRHIVCLPDGTKSEYRKAAH